jgi:hypothetical protein
MIRQAYIVAVAGLLLTATPLYAQTGTVTNPSGGTDYGTAPYASPTPGPVTNPSGGTNYGTAPNGTPATGLVTNPSGGTNYGTAVTTTAQRTCDAQISAANQQLMAQQDQTKKQEGIRELGLAQDMKSKNDERGCMTHAENAMRLSQ